jgi:methylenetetrahydrofolate reductase (NADPH)
MTMRDPVALSSVGPQNGDCRSRLERVLRSGRFAVTAELNPPDSADPQEVYDAALVLSSICDGINAVDASGANCHMSSVAICALLTRAGYEPVYQVSCRDRNRIAIQGDLLGAAAMGVRNVLCITGDDVTAGDQPEAKRVFDLDSIQLLHTARIMRDYGVYLSGRKLTVPPPLFLGAAENPFAPPFDWRPQRLAKKVAAGAEFIQTQYCFDMSRFQTRVYAACARPGAAREVLHPGRCGPAAFGRRSRVHAHEGARRLHPRRRDRAAQGRAENKQRTEGKKVCIEIIQQVREIAGVAGVHIMAYRQEELVAEIVEEAGLLPRPFRADVPHPARERHLHRPEEPAR